MLTFFFGHVLEYLYYPKPLPNPSPRGYQLPHHLNWTYNLTAPTTSLHLSAATQPLGYFSVVRSCVDLNGWSFLRFCAYSKCIVFQFYLQPCFNISILISQIFFLLSLISQFNFIVFIFLIILPERWKAPCMGYISKSSNDLILCSIAQLAPAQLIDNLLFPWEIL